MTAKISFNNRIKIGFAFAIVFLLVIATNRLDKKRFDTLNNSLTSVYEDRLVAKGYLYELNNIFHEEEKLLAGNYNAKDLANYHNSVQSIIEEFKSTRLTNQERTEFNNLQDSFKELKGLENSLTASNTDSVLPRIKLKLNRIQNNLDDLALIQLSEGESLTKFAQNSLNMSSTMSKIEIAIIIIIGFVVQFIIFYK